MYIAPKAISHVLYQDVKIIACQHNKDENSDFFQWQHQQ